MAPSHHFRFAVYLFLVLQLSVETVADDGLSQGCIGWKTTQNYCFRLSDAMISRPEAASECKKLGAMLLRLYQPMDLEEFLSVANTTQTSRWWTDLNDFPASGVWVWGQAADVIRPDTHVLKWNTEPDDHAHLQNCIALNIQGAISDQRCSDKHGYVCEYRLPAGGSCLNGWSMFQSSCYNFVDPTDPWNIKTWNDAYATCATIAPSTAKGHLLFLETATETAYIRKQLPMVKLTSQLWWIGMDDIRNEGQFQWTDGTVAQTGQLVWDNEPNNLGGGEKCGVIFRNGYFGDLNCSQPEHYACMKYKKSFDPVLNMLGCPGGWIRAGHKCYLMNVDTPKTWPDARSTCQQSGAKLVQIISLDEKAWFEQEVSRTGHALWTGLTDQGHSKQWQWADGTIADTNLIRWNQEPNNYAGVEDCASISQSGTFNDVSCLRSLKFICEMKAETIGCPTGWLNQMSADQTACYFISNITATDDEAKAQCLVLSAPRPSYLLAINNKDELTYITSQLQQVSTDTLVSWYTGLTDRGNEGYWKYDTSFNPPPKAGFIPWNTMPKYIKGDEHCAYVTGGGRYKNTRCSRKLGYMCQKLSGYTTSAGSTSLNQKAIPYKLIFSSMSIVVSFMFSI